jgi:hypothetical protein
MLEDSKMIETNLAMPLSLHQLAHIRRPASRGTHRFKLKEKKIVSSKI